MFAFLALAVAMTAVQLVSAVPAPNKHTLPCIPYQKGHVRYNYQFNYMEQCDGSKWTAIHVGGTAAKSCYQILLNGDSHGDGYYTLITKKGYKYQAYCDMTLDGGGWTLFATKASAGYAFLSYEFKPYSAKAVDYDAKGCIPGDYWTEVLFRFRHDYGASRVVYHKKQGTHDDAKANFDKALQCDQPYTDDLDGTTVDGFHKASYDVNHGARYPGINFDQITKLMIGKDRGISQIHATGLDDWLDLWDTPGGGPYYYSDYDGAKGTKCLASHCYLEEPVWCMYR